jgi:hypothetical protein
MGGQARSPPSSYQHVIFHIIAKGILPSRKRIIFLTNHLVKARGCILFFNASALLNHEKPDLKTLSAQVNFREKEAVSTNNPKK